MKNNKSKRDLAKEVASAHDMTAQTARKIVNTFLETMREEIVSHGRIEIRGFGVFEVVTRAEKEGRNPKTGERVQIAERQRIKFKPSALMLAAIELKKAACDASGEVEIVEDVEESSFRF